MLLRHVIWVLRGVSISFNAGYARGSMNFTFLLIIIKAQAYKKMTILFFVSFGTHNNKIHRIYKQTSVFILIFSMLLFCFY
jgi:hypothetical protein